MSSAIELLKSQLDGAISQKSITFPSSKVTQIETTSFINNIIGSKNLKVSSVGLTLDGSGELILNGKIKLFSVNLDLTWTFSESASDGIIWTFSAQSDGAALSAVLKHYLSEISGVPKNIAGLQLTGLKFESSFDTSVKHYKLDFTATTKWGAMELDIDYNAGKWGIALGIDVTKKVTPAKIWNALSPFDVLSFSDTAVVIANYTNKSLKIAGVTGVVEGVEFRSKLTLQPNAPGDSAVTKIANEIATSLQSTELDVTIDLDIANENVAIEAKIPGPFDLPGYSALKLSSVDFKFNAKPLSLELDGTLDVPVTIPGNPGVNSITIMGTISFTYSSGTGSIEATLSSDTKIVEPFKIPGFTLLNIGFGIDVSFGAETGAGLSFMGGFELGKNKLTEQFALTIEFTDDLPNPSLLYLNSSKLSLPDIFEAVISPSITLPSELDEFSFEPLVLYWCDKAQTVPVGPLSGSPCDPGVGFNAGVQIWNFDFYAALMIETDNGITGTLDLDPISLLDGKISVTGKGKGGNGVKPGGATLDFDTTKQSFSGSVNANILGLKTVDDVNFSSSSLALTMKNDIGFFKDNVSVAFTDLDNMSFSAGISIGLDIKPTINLGGLKLGTIHVNDKLTGTLSVKLEGTKFTASVSGSFKWNSHGFGVSLDISEDLTDLKNLGTVIGNAILKNVDKIFGTYFSKVTNYLEAVGKGLLTGGDFVLDVLDHAYQQTVPELFDDLAQLPKGFHIDGKPDFHLDVSKSVPSTGFHADLGQIINSHFDHHQDAFGIGHHENIHADLPASKHFSTPKFNVSLLNIGSNSHYDTKMPPTVHADASSPRISLSPGINAGIARGSIGISGKVRVNSKVSLNDISFKAGLSVKEHADAHGDVVGLGAHGDTHKHQDTSF